MLRPALTLTLLSAALLFAGSAAAYKPAPIQKPITYTDADKTVSVSLTARGAYGPAKVTVTTGGKTTTWPQEVEVPTTGVVAAASKRVVLLGGYGDSGVGLGLVVVYDLTGKELKRFDLRKHVSGLKGLSEGYRKVCCPFPWVHATSLARADSELHIDICGKKTAVIDLVKLAVAEVR